MNLVNFAMHVAAALFLGWVVFKALSWWQWMAPRWPILCGKLKREWIIAKATVKWEPQVGDRCRFENCLGYWTYCTVKEVYPDGRLWIESRDSSGGSSQRMHKDKLQYCP